MNLDLRLFILEIICLKKKDRAYVINLDEYPDIGTHWVALYVDVASLKDVEKIMLLILILWSRTYCKKN